MISKFDPSKTSLSHVDMLEYHLIRLDEEDFKNALSPISLKQDAPSATGDPVVDEWEREFWRQNGTK